MAAAGRALIVGNRPAQRRVLFLGAATSCHSQRWVRWLRDEGYVVLWATLHRAQGQSGVVSLVRRGFAGFGAAAEFLPAARRLDRIAARFRPDVTIAYYLTSYGTLAALAGLSPLVAAAGGGDVLEDDWDSPLRRTWVRSVLASTIGGFDRALAWSPHVGDRLVELGVPKDRILVQARGVDSRLFPYGEPRRRTSAEPLRIVSTRWLKPLYRVDTLAHALVELERRGVPFEARIAGAGPEQPRVAAILSAVPAAADRVRFLGHVAADDMPAALRWADVYVSTSSTDGASASLFEALSLGLYPVVSDIAANRAFLRRGIDSEFFPVGDAGALASILATLATDEPRRHAGIAAARPVVAERLDYTRNMRAIMAFALDGVRLL